MDMKRIFFILSEIALHTTNNTKLQWSLLVLTVIMGSRGPNISSLMISESRGTSSKMLGEILLPLNKRKVLT